MEEFKCVFSWFPKAGFDILYMKMHQPNLKNHKCFILCHIVLKFLEDMHKGHRFQLNILNVSNLTVHVVSFKAFFQAKEYLTILTAIHCHILFLHFEQTTHHLWVLHLLVFSVAILKISLLQSWHSIFWLMLP
jgi:hypothetical protein